jgi:hypothetical protein
MQHRQFAPVALPTAFTYTSEWSTVYHYPTSMNATDEWKAFIMLFISYIGDLQFVMMLLALKEERVNQNVEMFVLSGRRAAHVRDTFTQRRKNGRKRRPLD